MCCITVIRSTTQFQFVEWETSWVKESLHTHCLSFPGQSLTHKHLHTHARTHTHTHKVISLNAVARMKILSLADMTEAVLTSGSVLTGSAERDQAGWQQTAVLCCPFHWPKLSPSDVNSNAYFPTTLTWWCLAMEGYGIWNSGKSPCSSW